MLHYFLSAVMYIQEWQGLTFQFWKKKENYKNNVYNMINVDIFSFGMY